MSTKPIYEDANDPESRIIGREFTCKCGATVESWGGMDTDCDRCGRDFNAFGQELRPPDEWEEPWDDD